MSTTEPTRTLPTIPLNNGLRMNVLGTLVSSFKCFVASRCRLRIVLIPCNGRATDTLDETSLASITIGLLPTSFLEAVDVGLINNPLERAAIDGSAVSFGAATFSIINFVLSRCIVCRDGEGLICPSLVAVLDLVDRDDILVSGANFCINSFSKYTLAYNVFNKPVAVPVAKYKQNNKKDIYNM